MDVQKLKAVVGKAAAAWDRWQMLQVSAVRWLGE
jgi:hypothetical protein